MDNRKRCWCGEVHARSFTKEKRKHYSWMKVLRINRREGL